MSHNLLYHKHVLLLLRETTRELVRKLLHHLLPESITHKHTHTHTHTHFSTLTLVTVSLRTHEPYVLKVTVTETHVLN